MVDARHLVDKSLSGRVPQEESGHLTSRAERAGVSGHYFQQVLYPRSDSSQQRTPDQLLPRLESEVTNALVDGLGTPEVAHALNGKYCTVEIHLNYGIPKLNMNNGVSAALWAKGNT